HRHGARLPRSPTAMLRPAPAPPTRPRRTMATATPATRVDQAVTRRRRARPGTRPRPRPGSPVHDFRAPLVSPHFWRNRSTRPAVSTSFCRPVKYGWHTEQISTFSTFTVLRVWNVCPHAHWTVATSYSGWIPCFITVRLTCGSEHPDRAVNPLK